ncbi:unnamed protein product [Phytophthora lilii]|uniref:Unnamed protein product n=1 Tax=Phytophthora lilii TaxID=2077276 RepID=A0A9W6TDP9_9STRA|nr:unnamed protein product [Phytophthora lilii]
MKEKLRRWKLEKQRKQNATQRATGGKGGCTSGGAASGASKGKRKLLGATTKTACEKQSSPLSGSSPARKAPRLSASGHQKPMATKSTSKRKDGAVDSANGSKPRSAPSAPSPLGSAQSPSVIDDDAEMPISSSHPPLPQSLAARKLSTTPVRVEAATSSMSQSPHVQSSGASSNEEPEERDNEISTPSIEGLPTQKLAVRKSPPVPEKTARNVSQNPPRQEDSVVRRSYQAANERDLPVSISQSSQAIPSSTLNETKAKDHSGKRPEMDKENVTKPSVPINQNLPLPTVTEAKKPELLAKDLIRVAIGFEKKNRLVTAFSIFKRANYLLPKESAKLVERLSRLELGCPEAVGLVPSQDISTAAYMTKVLEHDLMAVLNHGSANELTELHTIGAKKAEMIFEKRPFHQVSFMIRSFTLRDN